MSTAIRKGYERFFTLGMRSGKEFVKLSDQAPQELSDLVRKIHFDLFDGCLPNDWIYSVIYEAFELLEHESIDNMSVEPDVYYSDLYKWFGEPFAHEYCNEAIEVLGEFKDVYSLIGQAQCMAMDRIYRAVDDFINEES